MRKTMMSRFIFLSIFIALVANFHGAFAQSGYRVDGEPTLTANGFKLALTRKEGPSSKNANGKDANLLEFEVDRQSNYRLRVKVGDVNPRFEVPLEIEPSTGGNNDPLYDVEYSNDPFTFKVVRKSNGAVLFDSSAGVMTFADQYIEISTKLPSTNLYGIGEQEHPSFKHKFDQNRTWPLWARDNSPDYTANLYGVQPHYTVVENDGNTHAVAIVNSNAQQFTVTDAPGLVYQTIGGVLDMYFFLGPKPEQVVQQYTQAVGRNPMPPYWALGFQLLRWGYDNIENMKASVDRNRAAGIPQDVQYADIDIMDRRLDFTYNKDAFHGLPEYVKELKSEGIKFVTIVDPAISIGEPAGTYPVFDRGQQLDVWMKKPDGNPTKGRVWPDDSVYFPDFSKNVTQQYWIQLIKEFHDLIEFDGLWIDMNEPANFVDGDEDDGCAATEINNPAFIPNILNRKLSAMTLCPDAVSSVGIHYDVHSLYGWFESAPTREGALQARPGRRPIVLSRSTFLGSGRWVAHWLGDNFSRWSNLHLSIIGMLQFNLFGIPFVGADICGFKEDATEEMCQRWMELGAFYPFSRNHNIAGTRPQDPAIWGQAVIDSSKRALNIRYELLPTLYTLFHDHVTQGSTVARALWHEFPQDSNARDIDTQFLWGQGFMISAVLEEGATSRDVYFPNARWFNYYDGSEVNAGGQTVRLNAPKDYIPLHFRGGFIFPTQAPALNTELSRQNPFGLTVALDENEEAAGHMYYDDGDSVDSLESGRYYLARYKYSNGQLETTVEHSGWPRMSELKLNSIRIMGARNVKSVSVEGSGAVPFLKVPHSHEIKLLNLNLSMSESFKIKFE